MPALLDQVDDLADDDIHPLGHDGALDSGSESLPVRLHARAADRGALAAVEHAIMDRGLIGGCGHHSAESIYLARKVPLADPTDRGVTGHLADVTGVKSHQRHRRTAARRCAGGLNARVTATDDKDVKHGERHIGLGPVGQNRST